MTNWANALRKLTLITTPPAISTTSSGRRLSRTLPLGQSESYGYDAAGNLKSKTDFNGKATTYSYDVNNRLTSKTPDPSFNAPPVSFTYSPAGLRKTMTDASGTTTYTYASGAPSTKVTPFGTLNYRFNGGQLLSLSSSESNGVFANYTYDTLGRLSQLFDARSSVPTNYTYDAVGHLGTVHYDNGVTTRGNKGATTRFSATFQCFGMLIIPRNSLKIR